MTAGRDDVDLPRFVRNIALHHPNGDASATASHVFPGVLSPFSGVLGLEPTAGDWPPKALSHLRLAPHLDPPRTAQTEPSLPSDRSERDPPADNTGQDAELRVRDIIRQERADRRRPSEEETNDDPPSVDRGEPPDPENESTKTDDVQPARQTIREPDSAILSDEDDHTAVQDLANSPDQPPLTVTRELWQSPSAVRDSDPRRLAGENDTGVTNQRNRSTGGDPSRGDRTVDGPDLPRLDVSSFPGNPSEDTDDGAGQSDIGARMDIREPSATADQTAASPDRHDHDGSREPRMTVKTTDAKQQSRPGDRNGNRSNDTRSTVNRPSAEPSEPIEDRINIDRLADKLTQVLDRRARIERERRGR